MEFKKSRSFSVFKVLKRKSLSARDIINMGFNNPYEVIQIIQRHGYNVEPVYKKGAKTCRYFLRGTYAQ